MLNEKIIKKFIFTWKSEQQKKNNNVYTFYVDPSSNKFQMKNSLEKLFGVKVEKICVSREKPILKNPKKNIYTKLKKKIFVKLKPGYKIGDFDANHNQSPTEPMEKLMESTLNSTLENSSVVEVKE
ncbi:MAG: hypothetical protein AM1032_000233 [Mycoplasmataceae bacterium]|nr:MAG: hypothetical protein AM1032_000233 [Mycoplasmataceae bacterium]